MRGALFVVATPIGNMKDITYRAVEVLKGVDIIIAERPRYSLRLLKTLGVSTKVLPYNEGNEIKMSQRVFEYALEGRNIALITDAGTPGIQDPGYRVVELFRREGLSVIPIPGPCALVAALSASGLPTDRFVFLGFPPRGSQRRRKFLLEHDLDATIILYESPVRVVATLEDVLSSLGERKTVVAREITKVYEEFISGSTSEVMAVLRERGKLKGEYVVLIGKKNV